MNRVTLSLTTSITDIKPAARIQKPWRVWQTMSHSQLPNKQPPLYLNAISGFILATKKMNF